MKIIYAYILIYYFLGGCKNTESNSSESYESLENGNLDSTFMSDNSVLELTAEQKFLQIKETLIAEGWEEETIQNGPFPVCFNFIPVTGAILNYLDVHVGGGTDVALKLMDTHSNRCIRYVFINSRSNFKIENIPEGQYYLKIAYGKKWLSKLSNGQCFGKVIKNRLYEKGEDILNYNRQYNEDGFSIPSFRLELDVIETGISNSFNAFSITEDEFNR